MDAADALTVVSLLLVSLNIAMGVCRLMGYSDAHVIWRIWQLRNYVVLLENEVVAAEKSVADNDHSHEQQLTHIADEVSADLFRIADFVKAGDTRAALREIEVLNERVLDCPVAPSALRLYDGPVDPTPRVVAYLEVPVQEAA